MASYQNSAGNQGIGREYYNWRYFNSNLQKLGSYSAPKLTDRPPAVVGEAVTNWADTAATVFQGAIGLFKARREVAYKEADDWLSKHSLEEYQQLMKENKVPFQDDPLAMERLKYRHGRILSHIAEQDFQARIDRGEFIGKEPEEVDLAHYQALYDAQKENADVFPYQTSDDYFFNQGFWEDASLNREKVFTHSKDVSESFMKDDALRTFESTVYGVIDGGGDARAIEALFNEEQAYNGFHFTTTEYNSVATKAFEMLSSVAWGADRIRELANKQVPWMPKGTTYQDIMGGAQAINDYAVNSENVRYKNDTLLRVQDLQNIAKLVSEGNTNELLSVATGEYERYGKDTDRGTLYFKAAKAAQEQQLKNLKEKAKATQKLHNEAVSVAIAQEYCDKFKDGKFTIDQFSTNSDNPFWESRGKALGGTEDVRLTESLLNTTVSNLYNAGVYKPEDIVKGAYQIYPSGSTHNPFRNFVTKQLGDASSVLISQVNGAAMSNVPKEFQLPVNIDTIKKLYMEDPSILGLLGESDRQLLDTIIYNEFSGEMTFQQAMNAMTQQVRLQDGNDKTFKALQKKFDKELSSILTDTTITKEFEGTLTNDGRVKRTFRNLAINYKLLGVENWKDCLTKAKEQIENSYYQVGGQLVRKDFFTSSYLSPRYSYEVANEVGREINRNLKPKHMDSSNVDISLDPRDDALYVFDRNSAEELMRFTKSDIDRIAKSKQDAVRIQMKLEDEVKGRSQENFMVDLNVEGKRGND